MYFVSIAITSSSSVVIVITVALDPGFDMILSCPLTPSLAGRSKSIHRASMSEQIIALIL